MDSFKKNLIVLNPSDSCVCISMDVVKSEGYPNKSVIENKLMRIANSLNRKYLNYLVVPFQVRRGDEIIGVLSSFKEGFNVFRFIRKLAWKYEIELYFGLGFGTLDTGSIIDVNRINGSAVINAFRAVDKYLKDTNNINDFVYPQNNQHVTFFALGNENIPYQAINALVYTIFTELNKSEKQKELIKLMELNPSMTYEELGIELGYTSKNAKVNVAKLISRSDYYLYRHMQKDLLDLLNKLQKQLG
ncbi:hypothetical protein ILS93_28370 [Bacillus sp. 16GRE42]|uniref:SatD family protein n=1 Tax=Bacillus sp. 16GRE42 TaxID=2778092 RepID=UPI001C9AB103|nr:SatD family protein [Bacillus sp. 16GRE42]MBY7125965.1 hypothetical protein [Bacillus sp. 16GRE42]